jgi:hypothetical protein
MNRREFVTSSVCACLATTVARVGAAFGAEGGPITVGGKQCASRKAFVETGRRCGTPLPSLYDIRRTQRVRSALRSNHVEFNTNTIIPVHFHVIHDGVTGNLPDRQLKAQVDLLNKVYRRSCCSSRSPMSGVTRMRSGTMLPASRPIGVMPIPASTR